MEIACEQKIVDEPAPFIDALLDRVCWDSDRLHLSRVAIAPEPR